MVIEIVEPKQENWNSNLTVRALTPGDYFIISIDGYKMNGEQVWSYESSKVRDGKTSTWCSYLAYVDVYEYSFFDTDKREVITEKLQSPVRCSYFMSEAMYNKVNESKISLGKALKIGMKKMDSGNTTYQVNAIIINSSDTTPIESSEEEQPKENDKSALEAQILALKTANFDNNMIVNLLKKEFKEEDIKELLSIKK